jgi:hypothetical protein
MTANIIFNVGHLDSQTLSPSGTFTCITHSDKESAVLIVVRGEKHVYIADVNSKVPGLKEDKVYDFEPHKWYLAGRELELLKDHGFSRHVLKTGDSIVIPSDAPHCVHSLPSTIGMSIRIEETLCPNSWGSETEVSQDPVVRTNPTPVPMSSDHFGVSLHENLKVGARQEEASLVARPSRSACRGRRRYFEFKQDSNELAAFTVEGRLQPFPGYLVVGFLECTQFVPGSLNRMCNGAFVACSVDGSDGPWWLGFVKSLFYVPDIISARSDGVLQVYRWTGPLKLGPQNSFFPELFVETDSACFQEHVTLESISFSKHFRSY